MDEFAITPTPDEHSPTGVYIPSDLQDCFLELDRILPSDICEGMRTCSEADLLHQHFGLGIWMRNNWGLWLPDSRLKQFFDGLGVRDADSVSSLILASYWRYLNGLPLELSRQIVYDKIMRDEIKNGPGPSN